MPQRGIGVLSVLVLALPMWVQAQQQLRWEMTPETRTYELTRTPEGGKAQTQAITAQQGEACGSTADITANTFCTPLTCTGSGMLTVSVLPILDGTDVGASSLTIGCLADSTSCVCTNATTTTEPTEPRSTGTSPTTPTSPSTPPGTATGTEPTTPTTGTPTVAQLDPLRTQGTNLILTWHHPREGTPSPERFLIAYTKEDLSSLLLYAVPLHDTTDCAQVATGSTDIWCARLACPGVGDWQFTVQADYGTSVAPASNRQACRITETQQACTCQGGSAPVAQTQGSSPETTPTSSRQPGMTATQALQGEGTGRQATATGTQRSATTSTSTSTAAPATTTTTGTETPSTSRTETTIQSSMTPTMQAEMQALRESIEALQATVKTLEAALQQRQATEEARTGRRRGR